MSDLILTGRRNFLVRALGFAALPAATSVPVVAMPTISPDLVRRMDAWRVANNEWQDIYRAAGEGRIRLHAGPARLTADGERYYEAMDNEKSALSAMLNAIATSI